MCVCVFVHVCVCMCLGVSVAYKYDNLSLSTIIVESKSCSLSDWSSQLHSHNYPVPTRVSSVGQLVEPVRYRLRSHSSPRRYKRTFPSPKLSRFDEEKEIVKKV